MLLVGTWRIGPCKKKAWDVYWKHWPARVASFGIYIFLIFIFCVSSDIFVCSHWRWVYFFYIRFMKFWITLLMKLKLDLLPRLMLFYMQMIPSALLTMVAGYALLFDVSYGSNLLSLWLYILYVLIVLFFFFFCISLDVMSFWFEVWTSAI